MIGIKDMRLNIVDFSIWSREGEGGKRERRNMNNVTGVGWGTL